MKSNLTIENMGNINNAMITIKPLTIIAGENSTGKTFVTKSLYTILDAVYQNHFLDELLFKYKSLDMYFNIFQNSLSNPSQQDIEFQKYYKLVLEEIQFFIIGVRESNFLQLDNIAKKNVNKFSKFNQKILKYFEGRLRTQKFKKLEDIIVLIKQEINSFIYTITNQKEITVNGISSFLKVGFKKNFQITNLKHLINKNRDKKLKLSLDSLGDIEIENENIHFSLKPNGISQIQDIQNIIFFDSPIYTKIRKALEKNKDNLLFEKDEEKYLRGYPQYLDKLYNYIDKEYIYTPDFDDISKEIQDMMNGRLDVTRGGEINYTDKDNNIIPLSLTAMGIGNIGLIDLLIRNNIINKGSFLIMDEPEVHLHPKWQVFLAQILYKISKSGANVILATHSLDFLKAFENILKKESEDAEDIIAINKMPYDKIFLGLSELEKVGLVLDDLSKPYYDLYMEDI